MRFGAYLPTYWDDYGTTSIHVAIEEAATAAEALGYDAVWANDNLIRPAAEGRGAIEGAQVVEPLVTLATLVHLVPRVKLGTAVVVLPQRNPILVAKQAAALHLLSQQRLILGVGIGWRPEEFALLGADFVHRGAAADEAIELMRALWRGPAASYHGRFHHLDAATMLPLPPDGGPPIWVGGHTPGAIRRAATYGSGWMPFVMDLETFRSSVETLRGLALGRRCPTVAKMFYLRLERPDEPAAVQSTTPWVPERVAGSADAVSDHLERYRRAGLEYALCLFESEDLDDLLRQLRLFAERVAPRFSDGAEPSQGR